MQPTQQILLLMLSYSCLTFVASETRNVMKQMKRTTWTIEPDSDVASLVDKEMTALVGKKGNKRGLLTKIINESLRKQLAHHIGKRESK